MSVFKTIHKTRLNAEAVEQILALLSDGVFKIGDKLPSEREMAASMGISRPALREALAALEIVGVIESKPGSGTYIRSDGLVADRVLAASLILLEEEAPFYVMEARRLFEPMAAALAAVRARPEDLAELEKILNELDERISRREMIQTCIRNFHVAMAEASHNPVVVWTVQFLSDSWFNEDTAWQEVKLRGLNVLDIRLSIQRALHEIYDCIAKGDAYGARTAMERNFDIGEISSDPFSS